MSRKPEIADRVEETREIPHGAKSCRYAASSGRRAGPTRPDHTRAWRFLILLLGNYRWGRCCSRLVNISSVYVQPPKPDPYPLRSSRRSICCGRPWYRDGKRLHHDSVGTNTFAYVTMTVLEELLEMTGVLIFIYALLDVLRTDLRGSSFNWRGEPHLIAASTRRLGSADKWSRRA